MKRFDPVTQARIDLTAALRSAARMGLNEGVCNHFSLEMPGDPTKFLINPQGFHWSELTPADLMVVDYSRIASDVFIPLDEAALLARRATSDHLKQLVVAGRTIVSNGTLTGIALDQIQSELNIQVRDGMSRNKVWQQVADRFRKNLKAFYAGGLHRCG